MNTKSKTIALQPSPSAETPQDRFFKGTFRVLLTITTLAWAFAAFTAFDFMNADTALKVWMLVLSPGYLVCGWFVTCALVVPVNVGLRLLLERCGVKIDD